MSGAPVPLVLQWRRNAVFTQDPPGAVATIIGPSGSAGPQGPTGPKGDPGPPATALDGGTI